MTESRRRRGLVYPLLNRDFFKTSAAYLVSMGIHGVIFLFFLATVVLDGGGGPGDSYGGKGEAFSLLSGHGKLDYQTERMEESDSLEEEIAKEIENLEPLPEVVSEVVPDLSDVGVQLSAVAPRINPVPVASSMKNTKLASTGGGMAIGPGVGAGGGLGGGIGRGFGRGFGDFIGLLHKMGFEVVFVIDGSNSMQWVIDVAKQRIGELVATVQKMVPNSRVGMVIYKDKGEDFVTRKSDLTFKFEKLGAFVNQVESSGGGDYEEAVKDALGSATREIAWRKFAHRVIVLVPSSPPRKEEAKQIEDMVRAFHSANGILHAVDLSEPMHREFEIAMHKSIYGKPPEKLSPLPAFYVEMQNYYRQLAKLGGGELIPIHEGDKLSEQLLVAAFGTKWKQEVSKFSGSK